MKLKLIINLILLSSTLSVYAQEFGTGHELVPVSETTFEYFENNILKEEIPKKPTSPEQVLKCFFFGKDTSILSNIFTDIKDSILIVRQNSFDQQRDITERAWNELKLEYKLEFTYNNKKWMYASITYLANQQFHFSKLLLLNKLENDWKLVGQEMKKEIPHDLYLKMVLRKIKPEKLNHLMTGEMSGDPLLDQVIRKTRFNNGFDASLFQILTKKWRSENNEKMINYFYYPFY